MKTGKLTISSGLCALMMVVMSAYSEAEEKAGGCGANDGCGAAPVSQDPRLVKCECGVPIYQCDECRYEAGVVKVDPSLLKQADGTGLMRTQGVARTKMAEVLATTGEVALNENTTVHISPRISGIIETVSTDIGKRVRAGDVLLTIASVELGKALTDYERNKSLSELSGKVFARETRLKDQKVGSEQDMINAQMVFEQHRTDLKASEQMLRVLGLTDEELAKVGEPGQGMNKGVLALRAPAAGMIIEKHAVAGEMAESGKGLMLLTDLSSVWVWANVHSRDLAALLAVEKRGAVAVEIRVAAFPDKPFKGVLDYVGATMSEQTRTVKVRATIENADLLLRPGMFCDAAISLGSEKGEEVLAVPQGALSADEGKSFVFKYWKESYFVRQAVRVGREFQGMVEVLDGLQPGDVIVTDGAFLLKSDVLREKMGAGCAD